MPSTKVNTGNVEENVGCPSQKEEVNYFIKCLKKTSSITKIQLGIIAKRFRLNAAE